MVAPVRFEATNLPETAQLIGLDGSIEKTFYLGFTSNVRLARTSPAGLTTLKYRAKGISDAFVRSTFPRRTRTDTSLAVARFGALQLLNRTAVVGSIVTHVAIGVPMTFTPDPSHADLIYLSGMQHILDKGVARSDRTGTGTVGVFGLQQRYDLQKGFPLLTSKRVYPRGVFGELVFFLIGRTDNQWLNDRKIHIWDEWASPDGDLGPIYGYQWRAFGAEYVSQEDRDRGAAVGGVDQVSKVLNDLKNNPFSRRHIVSAWHPAFIDQQALPPCHTMFQFYVTPDADGNPYGLSCQLYQRSNDYLLGCPFNIASYAAITHLFADLVGLKPLEFIHTSGDAHIYSNHLEQCRTQLIRKADLRPSPELKINHPVAPHLVDLSDPRIFDLYTPDSFELVGYDPHPAIKAPISV